MPQDYRRFNGPDDSVSYLKYTKDYVKPYEELHAALLDGKQRRKDGRTLDEGRSMFATTDLLSQAKGSAYLEMKKTKVVCSVFDPREIPGQMALRQALEPCVCRHLFPNYQIDVFVYIIENDGSCLAAAINAAGLALANAAVPMYDIITSCSLAVIEDQIFIDPNREEEYLATCSPETNTNHGIITMSTLSELKQISDYRQVGSMGIECVTNALEILDKECEKILPLIQKILVTNVVTSLEQKKRLEKEAKEREEILNAKVEEWK
ncbi:mRNA transport regulator 3, partial [Operophtera brumata]